MMKRNRNKSSILEQKKCSIPYPTKITNLYFLSLLIFQVITSLGLVIYSALDFGLKENEERRLTPGLENILELMTSLGEGSIFYGIWGFIYRDCTYAIACSMQKGGKSCDFKISPPSFFLGWVSAFSSPDNFPLFLPPNSFFREIFSPHPRFPHTCQTVFPVYPKSFFRSTQKKTQERRSWENESFLFHSVFRSCPAAFIIHLGFPEDKKKEHSRNNRAFEFRRREAAASSFHLLFSGKLHHAAAIAFSRKTRLGSLDPFDPLACSKGFFFSSFPRIRKRHKKSFIVPQPKNLVNSQVTWR